MGTLIAGGAFFTYNSIQDGQNPLDAVKEVIDDLFDNAEAMSDPDPEQFNIQFLQMSGNPIQHIPMVAQDGEKIAPNIAIVLAMEGTLVKRVHDRKYGFRHIKRPAVAPLMKSLQGMDVSAFFWVKHMSNQSLGDPECIVYKMLKSEKLIRVAQEMSACVFSRSHMYSVNGQPQIRISPLPRFTPNILLVDNDRWNYDAQPDNTLLIKEFTDEEADDGSALMDVLAFMKLFRHLWKKQEVKTVQQTMRWLKMRHPEIVVDPTRMGEFIRAEAADLLENEHRLQTESVGRVLKDLHRGSATLRGARAVTAHSSTYERVHQSSALADRISKAKERQAALIAQHQQKMAEEAAGSMSDQ